MIVCDMCGQVKECAQRQIDGRDYDICHECWNPVAEKLKGKGRAGKEREIVFLPPVETRPESPEPKPRPGEPPKIWGGPGRPRQGF